MLQDFLALIAYNLEMRDSTRGVQMSLITFIFCFLREEKSNLILFFFSWDLSTSIRFIIIINGFLEYMAGNY